MDGWMDTAQIKAGGNTKTKRVAEVKLLTTYC